MFFFRKDKIDGSADWMIAGLGNPGSKYEFTRHNAGFICADILCGKLGIRADRLKFRALYGTGTQSGGRVILLKPQTFMNLSGESVREAAAFFQLPPERIIVIYDDVSLPAGKLRIRRSGSDGGHNGIKNIIYHLKTNSFPRIKIGIGSPPHPDYDMADWVTSRFSDGELKLISSAAERASLAALEIIGRGIDSAMNLYNSDKE